MFDLDESELILFFEKHFTNSPNDFFVLLLNEKKTLVNVEAFFFIQKFVNDEYHRNLFSNHVIEICNYILSLS